MDIGTFLKLKRQEKGITQKEIADAVGVSEGTVSRWESGKIGNMRRDKIESLANVLSIDPVILTKYKNSTILDDIKRTDDIIKQYSHAFPPGVLNGSAPKSASTAGAAVLAAGALAGAAVAAPAAATAVPIAAAGIGAAAIGAALANFASAAKALSNIVESNSASIETNTAASPELWSEEERQMIEEYRTLSESDQHSIRSMIHSLSDKTTATSNKPEPEVM